MQILNPSWKQILGIKANLKLCDSIPKQDLLVVHSPHSSKATYPFDCTA